MSVCLAYLNTSIEKYRSIQYSYYLDEPIHSTSSPMTYLPYIHSTSYMSMYFPSLVKIRFSSLNLSHFLSGRFLQFTNSHSLCHFISSNVLNNSVCRNLPQFSYNFYSAFRIIMTTTFSSVTLW